MEIVPLKAEIRAEKKKGEVKRLRRERKIPGVLYGPDVKPVLLTLDKKELLKVLRQGKHKSLLVQLEISAGSEGEKKKCLLKELQWDHMRGEPIHVDLYAISDTHSFSVSMPISFKNTPVGVTKGGIFEPIMRELSVSCRFDRLLDSIDVDVSRLDIGDALHVRDIPVPEGVKIKDMPEEVVALVSLPSEEGTTEAKADEKA